MISQKKQSLAIAVMLILLSVGWLWSVNAGYANISYEKILKAVFGNSGEDENLIILMFRLPRMTMAILVGIGFSLSGLILQGLMRNDLADPGLMGINSGAGIVFLIFIVLGEAGKWTSAFVMPFLAFVGAGTAGIIIYILSREGLHGINPMKMILNGVAIQAGINAVMVFAVLKLDENQYEMLTRWQTGSIWRANWQMVWILVPWIVVGYVSIRYHARHMDVLALGEELAIGVGLPIRKVKRRLLIWAIALAAASVSMSGSISFVGLMAPHIAKRLFGVRHHVLIPACSIIGAIIVLIADTVGRTIIMPSELPAGIMVAIIGAPYFLSLLLKRSKIR